MDITNNNQSAYSETPKSCVKQRVVGTTIFTVKRVFMPNTERTLEQVLKCLILAEAQNKGDNAPCHIVD